VDLTNVTLSSLLSPGGLAAAGAITYLVVEIAKKLAPTLDARISGALQATVVLAILYAAALVSTPGTAIFTAILYFLIADATAIGISSAVGHVQDVTSPTTGITRKP
jgi:hypothetical protein